MINSNLFGDFRDTQAAEEGAEYRITVRHTESWSKNITFAYFGSEDEARDVFTAIVDESEPYWVQLGVATEGTGFEEGLTVFRPVDTRIRLNGALVPHSEWIKAQG